MSHDDFAFEPRPGLPAALPEGEHLLWQGSPDWRQLAIHAYHARKAGAYFLLLVMWRIGYGWLASDELRAVALNCLILLMLGLAAVGILTLLAYLSGRAAIYSITSKRLLLRHGVAVPLTLNIPFKVIESADLKLFGTTCGDIVLRLFEDQRIGYLITWPYLRPSAITRPQPCLRALGDAPRVAAVLGEALTAYSAALRPELPDRRRARVVPSSPARTASAA